MKKIAVFASGSGSNAENIVKFFTDSDIADVTAIFCNNSKAGVIDRAKKLGVRCVMFKNEELGQDSFLQKLRDLNVDLIVLAGFLRLIPPSILEEYEGRIVNVHPALLPDYGGKGMYGMNVHEAIVANEEEETGITIHYVTEEYDEGEIIFQESVEVDFEDTAGDVAYKVQMLEHKHYPAVIEYILKDL